MKYYAGIGSRETPKEICNKMTEIASLLEKQDFVLRSGGAQGADHAFEIGISDQLMMDIYLPKKIKNYTFNRSRLPLLVYVFVQ